MRTHPLSLITALACSLGLANCSTSEAAEKKSDPHAEGSASGAHGDASGHASAHASAEHSAHAAHNDHPWLYTGDKGPPKWGELDPKWEACSIGKDQSPIDLPSVGEDASGTQEKLSVDYMTIPLRVKNNGHTIEVQNRTDSFITVGTKRYDLLQFHFHSPSEHTIGGQRYPLEVHFVNKSRDGELAVVGVLFETGDINEALSEIWKKMPRQETQDYVNNEKKLVDVSSVISLSEGYYHYPGSLTTPPCSEGVRWFVMKETKEIEKRSVDLFREVLGGRSNRPVQPLGSRKVLFMSH